MSKTEFKEAHTAYHVALNQIKQGLSPLAKGAKISFLETIETEDSLSKSSTKTLSLDASGEEFIHSPSQEQASSEQMNWDVNILVNPLRFPQEVQLLRTTEDTWVFLIPNLVKAGIENVDDEIDQQQINSNIESALTTELTISRASPRFLSLKTYAQKPFKPEAMVKVNEFNVRMEFAEAWPNGPLAIRNITKVIKGRYALFVSVNEVSVTSYKNFQRVD